MLGHNEAHKAVPPADLPSVSAPPRFSLFRALVLICGVLLWLCAVLWCVRGFDADESPGVFIAMCFLPPLGWMFPQILLFLHARRWLEAFCVVLLYPMIMLVNYVPTFFVSVGFGPDTVTTTSNTVYAVVITAVFGAGWLALGLWRYWWVMRSNGGRVYGAVGQQWLRNIGVLEILLMVLSLEIVYALVTSPAENGPTVRTRASELVLAASSVKTALSEGRQTTHTWSAQWMSSVTISATGLVSSATISPTGQIIVYGTKATSNAVVTMTPTVMTDESVSWSCSGHPAKYMPASCR